LPRATKLTWQAGAGERSGRWRKKYRGKIYYFDGGYGKTDREAYEAAVRRWELEKLKADASQPRKYEQAYETAIDTWEQVLNWAKRHGDLETAQTGFEKLQKLRAALEAPLLSPLPPEDRFGSTFEPVTVAFPEDFLEQTARSLANGEVKFTEVPQPSAKDRMRHAQDLDGSPLRIQREVWDDRLESQQRRATLRRNTVEEYVQEFLRFKEGQADQDELSLGRVYAIRLHLTHFQEWIGQNTSVTEIDGQILRNYHSKLLEMIKQNAKKKTGNSRAKGTTAWTSTTARHYLVTMKSFVRWLWEIEAIPTLPRVLGSKSTTLNISAVTPVTVTFDDAEIQRLIEHATGRTKLYMLLMLNCGMTQKDVADLLKSEVDLKAGRIIRKRSKTDQFESVPTVNYLLWPATLTLLKQFMDDGESRLALLNSNGSPLWTERYGENGKYSKTDNIKNAFDRLKKELKINKPLKSFKKSSATKLRGNERFNGLEDLFLGHAPQKMSDKHYTAVPLQLLDTAISWLAEQYKLETPAV